MNTIGIIAEFNPFHNGHLHLIESCKRALDADHCVIIMSGDFVQRGAPSLVDKFTRTKMALSCGIDLVLELPVYYSLSSAEYFAGGAVSILDKLGCIDYLCFGSECGDIAALTEIANILNYEPNSFKLVLEKELKAGESFASARQKALFACLEKDNSEKELSSLLSSPNNILAIEYIRALQRLGSRIKPYTIKRLGEDYHSDEINAMSSASAIRNALLSPTTSFSSVEPSIPSPCLKLLRDYDSSFAENNKLSELLYYKLLSEKSRGYTKYLDISEDFSNKTVSRLDEFSSFDEFCALLKSKDLAYARISRSLCHILLDITDENMDGYKKDHYTSYARILGMKKASSDLVRKIRETASIPVIGNLKEATSKDLSALQMRLLNETLFSGQLYAKVYKDINLNEFSKPLLVE